MKVSTSCAWVAMAVGIPSKDEWPEFLTFASLKNVTEFQMQHAAAHGAKDPHLSPQAFVAATEQGWKV